MANKVLILGASGCGKSTAISTLDPQSTFIIQCTDKLLPFKGSSKLYNKEQKNICVTTKIESVLFGLDKIDKMEKIKTLVIDDFNYLMTYGYKARAKEAGYEKYSMLAFGIMDIFAKVDTMRKDLIVYFMAHTQKDNESKISMKTIGKFLDDKLCVEGLFSMVILALGTENKYQFTVNGTDPAKTPVGMFENNDTPNDLQAINEAIKKYF